MDFTELSFDSMKTAAARYIVEIPQSTADQETFVKGWLDRSRRVVRDRQMDPQATTSARLSPEEKRSRDFRTTGLSAAPG